MPVWELLVTDQFDPWQFVPKQVFTHCSRLLISTVFVVVRESRWLSRGIRCEKAKLEISGIDMPTSIVSVGCLFVCSSKCLCHRSMSEQHSAVDSRFRPRSSDRTSTLEWPMQ